MKVNGSMSIRIRQASMIVALVGCMMPWTAGFAASPEFRNVFKEVMPGVVNINTSRHVDPAKDNSKSGRPEAQGEVPLDDFLQHFFQGQPDLATPRDVEGLGSGFVLTSDGFILTNAHVVKNADDINVRFADHSEKAAKVIGLDERLDIAVLKVDAKGLKPVKLGDSEKLEVGDWVLAVGSPFGLDQTATQGIVSALGRSLPGDNYIPFIQTDAAVNPGNSGGPLVNTAGEVVGINSQIYSQSGGYMGLSFAIPIKVALRATEEIKQYGEVSYGWLGVMIQPLTRDLAESLAVNDVRGALVAQVVEGGPAARAGINAGDIIIRYGEKPIDVASDLPPLVGQSPIGDAVPVQLIRNGETKTISVKIEKLTQTAAVPQSPGARENALAGLTLRELTPQERSDDGVGSGVFVEHVGKGPAQEAGIQSGDVILRIGDNKVNNVVEFEKELKRIEPGRRFPVLVHRGDASVFIAMSMPKV